MGKKRKKPELSEDQKEAFAEVSTQFSNAVVDRWNETSHTTIYRELPFSLQLEAVAIGTVTGMLTVMFARVDKKEHDRLYKLIIEYTLPQARMIGDMKANTR